MSDDLVKRLRHSWDADKSIIVQTGQWMKERSEAADRIEALTEQLAAAHQDADEAEAYAWELEQELGTCRMAQAVMDNTVADLEAKLAKAVKALDKLNVGEGWAAQIARATLANLKGDTP